MEVEQYIFRDAVVDRTQYISGESAVGIATADKTYSYIQL